jgi:CubicO group peptidase (beta-lactamase class C family)
LDLSRKKSSILIAATILGIGAAIAIMKSGKMERLGFAINLFSGEEQYENFNRMAEFFPVAIMTAASDPFDFPVGTALELPKTYTYEGAVGTIQTFLEETDTSALLVLNEGKVVYENYWLTGGRDVNWLSMSVAKSFISAAVGIAVAEGHIKSIEEPVTQYAPSLTGSAYDGVRIKDILQMSSGARWNEDYSDPKSDVNQLGKIMGVGGDLNSFLATLKREREPGTYNQYNSMDTQVLGLLLVNATGRAISDYMQEKLWHRLGMESDAFWLIDSKNMEMVFFGLNATARDYAKLGELYRLGGDWQGQQVVPHDWVKASLLPDAPHLLAGDNPLSDEGMGYGYQWWLMDGEDGEYSAIGVYNQFIYVNPSEDLVIVKLSANNSYGMTDEEASYREFETIEVFRAIANQSD